jgi:polynucleotide 5'-hydroxyl-kinase GRC3/NOL9
MDAEIQVPSEWRVVDVSALTGTVMVIGASDTGKSTFARYLFRRLVEHYPRVGFLDCDVGQSSLGLPTTLTLALTASATKGKPTQSERLIYFVGAVSPRGHMLPVVVGAYKLQRRAQQWGVGALVVDTTGLVDAAAGGGALKQWKIELLMPNTVFAFARGIELEHILWPRRRDPHVRVIELPVTGAVTGRPRENRIRHRTELWRDYFSRATTVQLSLRRLAVFGLEAMTPGRLLALQDGDGFALGLGVVRSYDPHTQMAAICTPLTSLEGVVSVRLGSLRLDPATWREIY